MMRTRTLWMPLPMKFTDPTYQFTADSENMMLGQLRNIYEGKCFRGLKILNITEINDTVPIEFDNQRRDSTGSSVAYAKCTVIIISKYDTVLCVVQSISARQILGKWEHGIVNLKFNKLLQRVKVGQTIPVKVGTTRFDPGRSNAVINAYMFVPTEPTQAVYHTSTPTPSEIVEITEIMSRATKFSDEIKQNDQYIAFSKMLSVSTGDIAPGAKLSELSKIIASGKSCVVSRAYVPSSVDPSVYTWLDDSDVQHIESNWVNVMNILIDDWIGKMHTCATMTKQYPTAKEYDELDSVWSIHSRQQTTQQLE